ncbi:hypothetical protein [uncultured Thomasclavelia sp.]|uniref:hypothetical protein n=1 Tax=uncultured Thomasclavelia sp. TaxID=3025759 RepID=UPI00280AC959|nr:hypothetical protein [uncultured Thomasclavelia sp.]
MKKITYLIGVISLLALVIILILSYQMTMNYKDENNQNSSENIKIIFDDDLVYDGTGELDLLDGVSAQGEDGTDLTNRLNAKIVLAGNDKEIRYSVSNDNGQIVYKARNLVLKNYQGPEIIANDHLNFDVKDLSNLVTVLNGWGELKGLDGFGKDITNQITYQREKVSDGIYRLTFTLNNIYLDSTSLTVKANISGTISDPVLELYRSSIELDVGSVFYPEDYIKIANDENGNSIKDQVKISSLPNTMQPGVYNVSYQLTSSDNSVIVTKNLEVKIR